MLEKTGSSSAGLLASAILTFDTGQLNNLSKANITNVQLNQNQALLILSHGFPKKCRTCFLSAWKSSLQSILSGVSCLDFPVWSFLSKVSRLEFPV